MFKLKRTMKRSIYIAVGLIGMAVAPIQAQKDSTLTRTVVVENEYNPSILDANKINVLPRVEEPTVSKKQIEYVTDKQPFTGFSLYPMKNLAGVPQQPEAAHGSIRLGYGNYGNVLGHVNYQHRFSSQSNLQLGAAFDGMNGKLELPKSETEWQSRYYQTRLNAGYTYRFDKVELGINGRLGLQTFNYLPTESMSGDKQNQSQGGIGMSLRSTPSADNWQYNAGVEFGFFGQDYLYVGAQQGEGNSETKLRAYGSVASRINEQSQVELKLDINRYGYSQDESLQKENLDGLGLFEDYTLIRFNPSYTYTKENIHVRIGAQVDWTTGFDSGLRFAPDVLVGFPFNEHKMQFYIEAKGGVMPSDFQRMNYVSPYWMAFNQPANTHMQLDGTVGLKANAADGFTLHLFAGYELRKNDLLVNVETDASGTPLQTGPNWITQGKGNAVKTGISAKYLYKDWINLSAQATYRKWSTDDALEKCLYTKPALDIRLNATGNVQKLNWEAGYQLLSYQEGEMDAVNDLYVSLSYPILKPIRIWMKADNLLNQSYSYYWGYPAEKLNFMIGASLRF